MNINDQQKLQEIISVHLVKARRDAVEARWAARRMRGASRSAQGDRKLFEGAADLAESNQAELEKLAEEINQEKTHIKNTVEPIATVELEFDQEKIQKFFFIPRRAGLTDANLLTPASPLGQAILGKRIGERFSYQITREGKKTFFSGLIKKIE